MERFLGAFDEEHLGVIRWDIRGGGGEVGVVAPALLNRSQWPLFLLPVPLLFVPSHTVRINAMDRVRRMSTRYERAEAVAGGFNHLVQLQENQTSRHLPAPTLPFTGSGSTFRSFQVAF